MSDRVEGPNAVRELLASGRRVSLLRVLEGARSDVRLAAIVRSAEKAGVPVESVARAALDRESARGAHQGVIAYAEPFAYTSLGDMLLAADGHASSLLLVLDHVTDPGNLGAVVRTADVVGAAGVVIPKDRAAAMAEGAYKAAAGAAEYVAIAREANLHRALEDCKAAGYWVVGASERADTIAWDAPLAGRLALVLGAEGKGLARLTEQTCDLLVRLPVTGHLTSLNVSAAAAVLAFEWARQSRDG